MKVKLIVKKTTYVEAEIDVSDYAGDELVDQIEWFTSIKYGTPQEDVFFVAEENVNKNTETTFEIDVCEIEKDSL